MRGHVITDLRSLVTETCCRCGVLFAMESVFRDQMLQDRSRQFYCPNGHAQHYAGKSDAQKLREAEERIERLNRRVANEQEAVRSERAGRIAVQGHLTRAKKKLERVEKGVCPECNRSFTDLRRHMVSKHLLASHHEPVLP